MAVQGHRGGARRLDTSSASTGLLPNDMPAGADQPRLLLFLPEDEHFLPEPRGTARPGHGGAGCLSPSEAGQAPTAPGGQRRGQGAGKLRLRGLPGASRIFQVTSPAHVSVSRWTGFLVWSLCPGGRWVLGYNRSHCCLSPGLDGLGGREPRGVGESCLHSGVW